VGLITVGVMGTHEGLRPLVNRYCELAQRIQFDFNRGLDKIKSRPPEGMYYYPLIMSFDRQGLASAASLARREPPLLDLGPRPNPPQTPFINSVQPFD
jgi:hypothetical protein